MSSPLCPPPTPKKTPARDSSIMRRELIFSSAKKARVNTTTTNNNNNNKSDDDDDDEASVFNEEERGLPASDIPEYEFEANLGKGQFGVVCSVVCKNNNRRYALKVCSMTSEKAAHDESELWGSLRNPRIVTLYRAWKENANLYFLMRYCEGGTLMHYSASYRDRGEPVPEHAWLAAFRDCCLAVDFMHKQSFVHCDLKPANMYLSRDRVVLGDLGSAREIGQHIKEVDKHYVAPEANHPEFSVHPSADIFSLGISFLELGGNLDVRTLHWTQLRSSGWTTGDFPVLDAMSRLAYLVRRCMAVDCAQRPTAETLLMDAVFADLPLGEYVVPPRLEIACGNAPGGGGAAGAGPLSLDASLFHALSPRAQATAAGEGASDCVTPVALGSSASGRTQTAASKAGVHDSNSSSLPTSRALDFRWQSPSM